LLRIIFGSLQASEAIISHGNKRVSGQPCSIPGLVNYLPQFAMLPTGIRMERLCRLFRVAPDQLLGYFPELEDEMRRTVSELSGGKLRLWQALLLILAPTSFTLLDEPFTHLAPVYVDQLKQALRELKARKGFLLTDHMYEPLLEIADEMWFMKSGQTFLLRSPEDLILHGYVRTMHIA
jgi:ABC-type branched-subunit amino acid transport system ATPase component